MLNDSATRRRILFVDDDAEYLQMLDRLLRLWSKNELVVLTAESASAALAIIQEQPLDLVVLDVCMPSSFLPGAPAGFIATRPSNASNGKTGPPSRWSSRASRST